MDQRGDAMLMSSSDGDSSVVESWIEWFCKQDGHEFFCEVDKRYIEDTFNMFGLREIIGHNYKKCLDIILDRSDTSNDEKIGRQCEDLYGLTHARFILTKRGQDLMKRKMKDGDFGYCPRICCEGQPVLPYGPNDDLDLHGVMIYCPRCCEIMLTPQRSTFRGDENMELDGAYFGATFAHLFLMQFPELWPPAPLKVTPFVPRVFGYKVRLPPRPPQSGNRDFDDESMQDRRD